MLTTNSGVRFGLEAQRLFHIDVGVNRHVVGRLLPGPHMLVDAGAGEPVGGLRRQQQVIDADAVVLLPGAGLIVPERVERRPSVVGANRVGQAEIDAARGMLARVCGRNSASFDPGRRDCARRRAVGMTL